MKYYGENYKLSKGSGNSIKLDAGNKTSTNFYKLFIKNQSAIISHCGRKPWNALIESIEEDKGLKDDSDITHYISDQIFGAILKRVNKTHIDKALKSLNDIKGFQAFNYEKLVPILDVETTQTVLFNVETLQVVPRATHASYELWLKKQDQKVKELLNQDLMPALVQYNPAESGGTTSETIENQEVTCVNSHTKPNWRLTEIKNPKLPSEFKALIDHLFPEMLCREYIYFYMYNMLTTRNHMHLLLHGARGIGKNSLVEFMAELVGQSNYYAVPKEFWDNNFNSELRHRRLIYLDEHKIDNKVNLSQLKIYSDERMAYHGKGLSIQGLEKNHASHVMSNNLEEVNHMEQESRRFSVPILTHENLSDVWGNDRVEALWQSRKDDDFIGNLGWWVLKNGNSDKFHKDRPYKSALFHEIVIKALFPWKAWIIETIESRETDSIRITDYQDDKLSYRGQPIGRVKIETFLASHKTPEGNYYGVVKQIDGERFIIPSKEFMPKTKSDSSFDNAEEDFSSMEF